MAPGGAASISASAGNSCTHPLRWHGSCAMPRANCAHVGLGGFDENEGFEAGRHRRQQRQDQLRHGQRLAPQGQQVHDPQLGSRIAANAPAEEPRRQVIPSMTDGLRQSLPKYVVIPSFGPLSAAASPGRPATAGMHTVRRPSQAVARAHSSLTRLLGHLSESMPADQDPTL